MSSEIVTVWESISKEDADKLTDVRKERVFYSKLYLTYCKNQISN